MTSERITTRERGDERARGAFTSLVGAEGIVLKSSQFVKTSRRKMQTLLQEQQKKNTTEAFR